MKQLANVEYIAGDIEISDDGGDLTNSLENLKIVVDQVEIDTVQPELLDSTNSKNNNSDNNKNNTNTISIPETEQIMKKKMRLISTDSGFGSFGRSESYVATSSSVDSILTTNSVTHTKKTTTKSVSSEGLTTQSTYGDDNKQYNEKADKLTPLRNVTQAVQRDDKIRDFQKVRNTTFNNIDDVNNGYELDARLINRSDGFSEVQCYFDENGSPKVRERNRNRRKATLKQTLKAKSLGASMDNDTLRQLKTPSCVSFSRLCKKFKETFRSKFYFLFLLF